MRFTPQSSVMSFIVILFSGLRSSSFLSDASSARFVVCATRMPILSRLPRSVRSFPTSIYYDTSSARAGASTFFDFFMNFLCFLKIWTAKKPAPPQRVYQELSEKL